MNHGLILPTSIAPEEYVFGASPIKKEVLKPDGQWDEFLPPNEYQNRNLLETYNCTAYGTLNCIEILLRFKFGMFEDFSERFTGVAAGTRPPGNNPHIVCQAIRHTGLISDKLLPFGDINQVEKYYSPDPLTADLLYSGKSWLDKWEFMHEWILLNTVLKQSDLLMETLTHSPVGIAVYAWRRDGAYYTRNNEPENHWATIYGYKKGEFWKCFDSYDDTRKKLAWNYPFSMGKKFILNKINTKVEYNWFTSLMRRLANI